MKMYYNGQAIKSMNVKHYELSTQDATVTPSDMQAGVTCYAKGKKVTGTGKAFEFASYGRIYTNSSIYSPSIINVIEITSLDYPTRASVALSKMRDLDFSTVQTIGYVIVDNVEYPITVQVNGVLLTITCEKTIELQAFYGKDNYI